MADALSRLPFTDKREVDVVEESFDMSPYQRFTQPMTFRTIEKEQQKDRYIAELQQRAPERLGELFEDLGRKEGSISVLTEKNPQDGTSRIIVPETLRSRLVEWYHTMLVHPGVHRLYNTLRQHYTWPKMLTHIQQYTKRCKPCQLGKRGLKGYGEIPLKDVETEPWKDIAVDLSGPWQTVVDNKEVNFHTLTIIDVFTGWVEIIPIYNKKKEVISDLLIQEWLRRYPRPSRIIYDAGGEFDNYWLHGRLTLWEITEVPITIRNPRANAIVERMHRVLGDMLRVQLVSQHANDDPVKDMTSAAAFAIRSTVHGVTQYTPGQLVFNKDMILRTHMVADIELVRKRREAAIYKNNLRENKRRIPYKYEEGQQVLLLRGGLDPKLQVHDGPFKVRGYDKASGTLYIQRNKYIESVNVRLVRPYFGKR